MQLIHYDSILQLIEHKQRPIIPGNLVNVFYDM